MSNPDYDSEDYMGETECERYEGTFTQTRKCCGGKVLTKTNIKCRSRASCTKADCRRDRCPYFSVRV